MLLNGILAFLNLGTGEIILIVAIILLLFGGKKIPELMRDGQSGFDCQLLALLAALDN